MKNFTTTLFAKNMDFSPDEMFIFNTEDERTGEDHAHIVEDRYTMGCMMANFLLRPDVRPALIKQTENHACICGALLFLDELAETIERNTKIACKYVEADKRLEYVRDMTTRDIATKYLNDELID